VSEADLDFLLQFQRESRIVYYFGGRMFSAVLEHKGAKAASKYFASISGYHGLRRGAGIYIALAQSKNQSLYESCTAKIEGASVIFNRVALDAIVREQDVDTLVWLSRKGHFGCECYPASFEYDRCRLPQQHYLPEEVIARSPGARAVLCSEYIRPVIVRATRYDDITRRSVAVNVPLRSRGTTGFPRNAWVILQCIHFVNEEVAFPSDFENWRVQDVLDNMLIASRYSNGAAIEMVWDNIPLVLKQELDSSIRSMLAGCSRIRLTKAGRARVSQTLFLLRELNRLGMSICAETRSMIEIVLTAKNKFLMTDLGIFGCTCLWGSCSKRGPKLCSKHAGVCSRLLQNMSSLDRDTAGVIVDMLL